MALTQVTQCSTTLSIIVPVYCNQGSLAVLFDQLMHIEKDLSALDMSLELIFVDDGSYDLSLNVLRSLKEARPSTRIIQLTRNFGATRAIQQGLRSCTGDCACVIAADLQDPPSLIIDMVKLWLNGCKYVVCERVEREDSFFTRLYSHLYHHLVRAYVIPTFPKGGIDMSLMDRSMLNHIVSSTKDVFVPVLAYWLGYVPETIQYKRGRRLDGKSKWTLRKKLHAFSSVFLSFTFLPVRFLVVLSLLISFLFLSYSLLLAYKALTLGASVPGFATLVFLITFIGTIIILILAILSEYIWRIYGDVSSKPQVVVLNEY